MNDTGSALATRDELAAWLHATEEKVDMAREAIRARRRRLDGMDKRSRGYASLAALVDSQVRAVEAVDTRIAFVRTELGEAPLPERCLRTDGHGTHCTLAFAHGGLHESNAGQVRRRWE